MNAFSLSWLLGVTHSTEQVFSGRRVSFRAGLCFPCSFFSLLWWTWECAAHIPLQLLLADGPLLSAPSGMLQLQRAASPKAKPSLGWPIIQWLENKGLVILIQLETMLKGSPSSRVPHGIGQSKCWLVHGFSSLCLVLHPSPPFYRFSSQRILLLLLNSVSESAFPSVQLTIFSVPAKFGVTE